jgi:hypothetical protein
MTARSLLGRKRKVPESIKANLIESLISTLVQAGLPRPVAEQIANAKKLCCCNLEHNGILTRQYILADLCTGDWREVDED